MPIDNDFSPALEQASRLAARQREPVPERIYDGMVGGIAIYYNPSLMPGVVEFRNRDGELLGVIHNVKQIDTSGLLPRPLKRGG